jgi:predicted GH43/DUF377 family glycosyl hydrolase
MRASQRTSLDLDTTPMTLDSAPLEPAEVSARRLSDEPLVRAGAATGYGPIFNAGVILHDGRYHLFARGVRSGYRRNPGAGARFLDYISDVLVFTSTDGYRYEFQQVLATSSPEGVHCYEDPRVQIVRSRGDEHIVMSYTNVPSPTTGKPWRLGVHRLVYGDGCFQLNHDSGTLIGPEGVPDKDGVLFNLRDGRVGLIHRIHPDMQLAVFESLDEVWRSDARYWDDHMRNLDSHTILRPSPGALGIGAGAPPIETSDGLLLFFHERDGDCHYTLRVALLDDATGRVKALLPQPIMRPALSWERSGDVDNVVFVQGAISRPDGSVYLTYGASDRHVGAASVEVAPLLAALRAA